MNPSKKFLILFLVFSFLFSSVAPTLAGTENVQKKSSPSAQTTSDYKVRLTPTQQSEPNILQAPSINNGDPQVRSAQFAGAGKLVQEGFGVALGKFGELVGGATTNIFKFEVKGLIEGFLLWMVGLFIPPDKPCLKTATTPEALHNCLIAHKDDLGLLAMTGYAIDSVTHEMDFGTKEYFASLNPFAAPVYAQGGVGTERLSTTILDMWQNIRNFSYVILALILVVIGFMVMLRTQVAPRLVVTATGALPKIILVLIMITFSFPIGALAIDLVRVFLDLIGCSFGGFCASGRAATGEFVAVANGIIFTATGAAFQIPSPTLLGLGAVLVLLFVFFILAFVIVARAGLAILKEWFMLFMLTLFAPLILLPGAIPGNGAIVRWWKDLLACVLCIVTMYFFVSFAARFMAGSASAGTIIGTSGTVGLGFDIPSAAGPNLSGFGALVALGILMYIPAICNIVRHALDIAIPTQGAVGLIEAGQGAKGVQNVWRLTPSGARSGAGAAFGRVGGAIWGLGGAIGGRAIGGIRGIR